jgi:acyl transferase domain-containing protein
MSGVFPGAQSVRQFWHNLRRGLESITFFTDAELERPLHGPKGAGQGIHVKAGAVLERIDLFDASFFNIPASEAQWIDPQHRLFLEGAWSALEDAGYNVGAYPGAIAVYAGSGINAYFLSLISSLENPAEVFQAMIANDKDYLATRVSYKLNLRGEGVTVQTACSSSLVAVHLACQSLLTGQCEMALAGGVSLQVPQKTGYFYQEGMILSPDGHCRAFDERAQGTIRGNGMGVVLLKMLADAVRDGDHIYALIKGSAINNDGQSKVGYTAPSVEGQAEVIAKAQAIAGVGAESISYVEAHGTGTPLGDPIEVEALTKIFRQSTSEKGFCAIGSVKTNVGHLDSAAGVTGLIKTALALKHGEIPPSLNFERPNRAIDFASSPFYVNTSLREWKRPNGPRRAGVSSFGIGGTNVHLVMEEGPELAPTRSARPYHLLTLSARTATALDAMTDQLIAHLEENVDAKLHDIAYTRNIGRKTFTHKRAVVSRDTEELIEKLKERQHTTGQPTRPQKLVFMFPGHGSHGVQMARSVYETEPIFRQHLGQCADLLKRECGIDLLPLLYPQPDAAEEARKELLQIEIAPAALFSVEYALAQLWISWGIAPEALFGHSLGEYTAACLAGVLSPEDALKVLVARGLLMKHLPAGAMLALPLTVAECEPFLSEDISLAAVNGTSSSVLAGPTAEIDALRQRLEALGVVCRPLGMAFAYHSSLIDPIISEFTAIMKGVELKPPRIPYLSNLTGDWITTEQATSPDYWARQTRQTVRFNQGVETLMRDKYRLFIEVGPGQTLSSLVRQRLGQRYDSVVVSSLGHPQTAEDDYSILLNSLGRLWQEGVAVNWEGYYKDETLRRVPLPSYPFERQRYWMEQRTERISFAPLAHPSDAGTEADETFSVERDELKQGYSAPRNQVEQTLAEIWGSALGRSGIGIYDNFFDLGGDSLLAVRIFSRLKQAFRTELALEEMFTCQNIAALSEKIQSRLSDQERQTEDGYHCAFEIKMGDEVMTVQMTEDEYLRRGLPAGAENFRLLDSL